MRGRLAPAAAKPAASNPRTSPKTKAQPHSPRSQRPLDAQRAQPKAAGPSKTHPVILVFQVSGEAATLEACYAMPHHCHRIEPWLSDGSHAYGVSAVTSPSEVAVTITELAWKQTADPDHADVTSKDVPSSSSPCNLQMAPLFDCASSQGTQESDFTVVYSEDGALACYGHAPLTLRSLAKLPTVPGKYVQMIAVQQSVENPIKDEGLESKANDAQMVAVNDQGELYAFQVNFNGRFSEAKEKGTSSVDSSDGWSSLSDIRWDLGQSSFSHLVSEVTCFASVSAPSAPIRVKHQPN